MDFILGLICLIIILVVIHFRQRKREKHEVYYKHSEKYRDGIKRDLYLQNENDKLSEGKIIRKSIKKIESDPQELAYVNDRLYEEELEQIKKKIKIIETNKLAFSSVELFVTLWPNRSEPRKHYSKDEIILTIKKLYPNRSNPEDIFMDLVDSQVLLGPLYDTNDYSFGINVIFHPENRDTSGRRIVLLNNTIWSQPKELF